MNSQPTSNDREERLKQIRQRVADGYHMAHRSQAFEDVTTLLSLIDSQVAGGLSHCALCEDPCFIYRDCVLANGARTATRMHDKCVEKVKEMRDTWKTADDGSRGGIYTMRWDAADGIITALQSLTLDQVEQEQ